MAKAKAKVAEVNGEDLHDVPVTARPTPPNPFPATELTGLEAKIVEIHKAGKSEANGYKTHAANLGTDKETFRSAVENLKAREFLPADSFARIREGRGTSSDSKKKGDGLFDEQEFADELNADTSRLVAFLKRLDPGKVQAAVGKAKALADLEAEFERRRKELLG